MPFSKRRYPKVRQVTCPYCDAQQDIAAAAISVFCKRCHKGISLQDYRFSEALIVDEVVTRGRILVEKKADVKARLVGGTIVVEGKVTGSLSADQLVQVASTAKIYGLISTPRLVMADGAIFVGRSEVKAE